LETIESRFKYSSDIIKFYEKTIQINENMDERSEAYRGSKDLEDGHSEKPRHSDAVGAGPGENIMSAAEREKAETNEPWYKARGKSTGREDPFEGAEEGDVEYKSMKWW
jgi:hypothetical protein